MSSWSASGSRRSPLLPPLGDFVPDASVVEALERGLRVTSDAGGAADGDGLPEDTTPAPADRDGLPEAIVSGGPEEPDAGSPGD